MGQIDSRHQPAIGCADRRQDTPTPRRFAAAVEDQAQSLLDQRGQGATLCSRLASGAREKRIRKSNSDALRDILRRIS
jgi:hypothetical protein